MAEPGAPGSNVATTSGAGGEPEWQFLQCFGERTENEDIQDADIISAVEFDESGNFLATGDRGGRVVIFERGGAAPASPDADERPGPRAGAGRLAGLEYRYLTEFQSHEPEFDYLKSLEIEEKINQVQWVPHHADCQLILSTNDKTVKLWKVYEKQVTSLAEFNVRESWAIPAGAAANVTITPSPKAKLAPAKAHSALNFPLRIPKVVGRESSPQAKCARVFANAHAYHINSVSVASDRQTFLSADDLRINLWHLDNAAASWNVLDIKPVLLEDLTEVITCAAFHPKDAHALAYASSKGGVKLCDLRATALCEQHAKAFTGPPPGERNFFSEITSSVSHMRFSRDGRFILTRDYMSLKLWDLAMEGRPLASYAVHENLRTRLCELYDNDCIFDKFNCCVSADGGQVATGTYSNLFRVLRKAPEWPRAGEAVLEASRDPLRRRLAATPKTPGNRFSLGRGSSGKRSAPAGAGVGGDPAVQDFGAKLSHLAWHPTDDVIAAAASNSLYLYCQREL